MNAQGTTYSKVIFLVGLGASADLYAPLMQDFRAQWPQAQCSILEWWSKPDFGMSDLKLALQDSKTILIGHSAGGIMALNAFAQWPDQVQRIIMLDSHIIHNTNKLPSIAKMLEIMVSDGSPEIAKRIENAYAPLIQNDSQFQKAFSFVVQWVNADFETAATKIKSQPPHFVLHIGFTDGNYKMLGSRALPAQQEIWGKYGMDVKCMPMNHFDMIDAQRAEALAELIKGWL